MSTVDYAAFPHIFDAVLDHAVAAKDEDTLRTIFLLSRSTRGSVFGRCCHHLTVDYRSWPVKFGTTLGGFWIPTHQFAPGNTVVDIYAGEDYSMYPLAPEILQIVTQAAPKTIRLLDHYGMEDVLPYPEPIDSLVIHTKNWCLNREPDPWFLMLPPNAKRVVINLIGCEEFGYPDVSFAPGHNNTDTHQELVLIATEGPMPPKDAEGVTGSQHFIIDNIGYPLLGYLEHLQHVSVTVVDAANWKREWSEIALPPDIQAADVGQYLITEALRETCLESTYDITTGNFIQHSEQVVQQFLQRVTFVSREEFRKSVGDKVFELMTAEAV